MSRLSTLAGTLIALAAAVCYGATVVFGRRLVLAGFDSATALGLRFTIAALLMFALLALTGRPLLPDKSERWRPFLIGALIYGTESVFFYKALGSMSATAAALLFNAYPALVALSEIALGAAQWSRWTLVAVALSTCGGALVVTSSGSVTLTAAGVTYVLIAAALFAAYMIAAHRFLSRSPVLTCGAWVCLGNGAAQLVRGLATDGLQAPGESWPLFLGTAVAMTAASALSLLALRRIGASRVSIVMTLDAFAASALAWLFLREPVAPRQVAGGAAILAAAVVVSLGRSRSPRPRPDHDSTDADSAPAPAQGAPRLGPTR